LETAIGIAERLRYTIENYPWYEIHPQLKVTVSLGLADASTATNHEQMLAIADEQLYAAKDSGRNRLSFTVIEDR
jgi:diguanylate cyclase (GGDEF)-like protein